jgi:hypothetical protein
MIPMRAHARITAHAPAQVNTCVRRWIHVQIHDPVRMLLAHASAKALAHRKLRHTLAIATADANTSANISASNTCARDKGCNRKASNLRPRPDEYAQASNYAYHRVDADACARANARWRSTRRHNREGIYALPPSRQHTHVQAHRLRKRTMCASPSSRAHRCTSRYAGARAQVRATAGKQLRARNYAHATTRMRLSMQMNGPEDTHAYADLRMHMHA